MTAYRVTWVVQVDADSPEDAVLQAADLELSEPTTAVVLQVRREPFDTPSAMWDVVGLDLDTPDMMLRRLR